MAPHGGKRRFFGTNPLAYGVPRGAGKPPLIADMATSQVAYVTVKDQADRDERIPLGWAVDSEGKPTTNPNDMR
jgi:LDH2 family malate/lactate/ureidoglycolate dehydrogenase